MLQVTVIGVISDTHLDGTSKPIPPAVFTFFAGVDLILHAGDLTSLGVLHDLATIAAVEAVAGNMDSLEVRESLPARKVINVEGLNLGLIHGWGPPRGIRDRVRNEFTGVQAIVYGHSHQPFAGWEQGIYFFNPGSTSRQPLRGKPSCGKLVIGEGIKGEIIEL